MTRADHGQCCQGNDELLHDERLDRARGQGTILAHRYQGEQYSTLSRHEIADQASANIV